ncbi:hypothetical protein N0B44_17440 [Roseibacterium beibuensis]|uniref:hypothetical protein n=1 Tax=[Roseibacterium] beibuensis TaxID=1193142 RepID=UPI00217D6D6E|nr:hypothetical protein [Roseibacterium beibuensis]MCS6624704.1 hypothetical protein [Roseibacterium beibuensis]
MAADALPPPPAQAREIDPLATEISGGHFALFDLYRAHLHASGGAIIEGRTFTDCLIEGPAVMLALEGVHFEGVNFGPTGGDVRNMLFRPMSGQRAIGSIPVRNCTFRNCQFHTLGITGGDDLLETLVRQVVTPG